LGKRRGGGDESVSDGAARGKGGKRKRQRGICTRTPVRIKKKGNCVENPDKEGKRKGNRIWR